MTDKYDDCNGGEGTTDYKKVQEIIFICIYIVNFMLLLLKDTYSATSFSIKLLLLLQIGLSIIDRKQNN